MTIRDILRSKGASVITIQPDATAYDAMRLMVKHNIGAVVVTDGEINGILSERDILRTGADRLDRLSTEHVRDLMTVNVISSHPGANISEVMEIMTRNRIRHLPVLEDGELRGIISIGDVVNALRSELESENQHLHAYIAGTLP